MPKLKRNDIDTRVSCDHEMDGGGTCGAPAVHGETRCRLHAALARPPKIKAVVKKAKSEVGGTYFGRHSSAHLSAMFKTLTENPPSGLQAARHMMAINMCRLEQVMAELGDVFDDPDAAKTVRGAIVEAGKAAATLSRAEMIDYHTAFDSTDDLTRPVTITVAQAVPPPRKPADPDRPVARMEIHEPLSAEGVD
jgi:hypothetical protein